MKKLFLFTFIILSAMVMSCKDGAQRQGNTNSPKTYAVSADSSDRPQNEALLKFLYPNDPNARVDFCSPILVDGKKYYFVQASYGFFNDGAFYYGFTDYHFVNTDGGNLKAEFSIKDTDTTFYGNEMEFESNSMKYSLVTIGKGSVGLTTVMSATNQGFWENYNLSLVTTDSIISLFDIESSFDNAMWFPDNPTVYDNEVKIVDNNQDMYELLVTHKEYEVIFKGEDLDYDTKVSTQAETRYVYSPQEIKFVEK